MKIKAILSDVDGTLLDYDMGVYDKNIPELAKQVMDKGIQFSLATGKAYFGEIARIICELNLSPLHIVNGGGMIINWKTGATPWYRPISEESKKKVVDFIYSTGHVFSVETKDNAYMVDKTRNSAYTKDIKIEKFSPDSIPTGVLKILIQGSANMLNENEIDSYVKYLKDTCKDIEVHKFSVKKYYGLDVTSEASTKHTAVLEYGKILGIHPSEMVAIGDGYNDYPLFTACGYKIAMGNAPQELREIADKVVPDTEHNGMTIALRHILSLSE